MMGLKDVLTYMRGQEEWGPVIDHSEAPPPPPPPPQPQRSLVGGIVMGLGKSLQKYENDALAIEAEIAAKNRTTPQTNAAISAMRAGLIAIAYDTALSDDERAVAVAPVERELRYQWRDMAMVTKIVEIDGERTRMEDAEPMPPPKLPWKPQTIQVPQVVQVAEITISQMR